MRTDVQISLPQPLDCWSSPAELSSSYSHSDLHDSTLAALPSCLTFSPPPSVFWDLNLNTLLTLNFLFPGRPLGELKLR